MSSYPDTLLNSCLVTKYKSGEDSCPSHQDDEPFIAHDSSIFTLSIGCERDMKFKNIQSPDTEESVKLVNNSLLSFSRLSQVFWAHEIPQDQSTSCRYSLTFRHLSPMSANSTIIIGDSNTSNLNFGSGHNTFGIWMPGLRIKAGQIGNIPSPTEMKSAPRNFVFHTGINDIRKFNHDPIPVLAHSLMKKCAAYAQYFPKSKVYVSHVLPTKDPLLNRAINEFNCIISQLSNTHNNVNIINHANFCDPNGNLFIYYGRHLNDGTPKHSDVVHLGSKGIALLCMNIKQLIVKLKFNNTNTRASQPSIANSKSNDNYTSLSYKNTNNRVNFQFPPYALPSFPNQPIHFSSPHFPPLPTHNSTSFDGDFKGALCSSLKLNKNSSIDGYQS